MREVRSGPAESQTFVSRVGPLKTRSARPFSPMLLSVRPDAEREQGHSPIRGYHLQHFIYSTKYSLVHKSNSTNSAAVGSSVKLLVRWSTDSSAASAAPQPIS